MSKPIYLPQPGKIMGLVNEEFRGALWLITGADFHSSYRKYKIVDTMFFAFQSWYECE